MSRYFFTSESVTEGHPDKICDQISDAVLDAIMEQDPQGRVACEATVSTGLVHIMGEISTSCYVDIPKITREVIRDIEGAMGVVVNAPMGNLDIERICKYIDIPLVVTVLNEHTDIQARLDAGASILNVSAASRTPEVVSRIREKFPDVPIIATGGPTPESISATVEAGANAISYTPPTTKELFSHMMEDYRER